MSPDGTVIATAAATGTVQLWETAGGTLLGALGDASVNTATLTFSPDGGRLAIDTFDARSTLWDVPSRSLVADLGSAGYGTFSQDGALLATARTGLETTFGLWDAETGETLGTYDGSSVAFDPTGARIGVVTTTAISVLTIDS
jgi:WD40 repeat protein